MPSAVPGLENALYFQDRFQLVFTFFMIVRSCKYATLYYCSNCLSPVIANLPTFIGNMSKTSLTSLSHLHPSLFPSTFPSALATKNSKPVFSTYRVFFSEFLPSLFLKMLHRTVTEDQTRQKSVHVSVVQCKLIAYFSRNSKSNFDRGHFPYCRNYKKPEIQC